MLKWFGLFNQTILLLFKNNNKNKKPNKIIIEKNTKNKII